MILKSNSSSNRSRPAHPSQVMSEKGWWEAEDSPEEEARQVADLAKGYSEDEGGRGLDLATDRRRSDTPPHDSGFAVLKYHGLI